MKALRVALFVLVCFFIKWVSNTELIPERAEVYYINKKYFSNATVFIKRQGRKSPYYINIEGTTLVPGGDNVSIHAVFYEYLHNEYKRSFVELDLKMCDLLHKSPFNLLLGSTLNELGFVCPLPPGTYRFYNITIPLNKFPYVWPFEKIMLQGYATLIPTQEIILRARFFGTFKRTLSKENSKVNM